MKSNFVPRVNQLDSIQLDNEIINILKNQIQHVLRNLPPGIVSRFQPETNFLLSSVLWSTSIWKSGATFGQQMLSITYGEEQLNSTKLKAHYFLTVALDYMKELAQFRFTNVTFVQQLTTVVENCLTCLKFINFFRFLQSGRKPSLVDYILRIDHRSIDGAKRRSIGYSYMTRELIWAGFMELLSFTIPIINYRALKRKMRSILKLENQSQLSRKVELNVNSKCVYCNERVTLPHHMGCGHVFCYYCLKGNLLADSGFQCNVCDFKSGIFEKVVIAG
ncbi:peroxisome biogenesis factor 2-like [Toxorhynchites rutilus septentrionalis]|uniref:peroxisome biogenesis factor 2-like n=1 Tax=Toxorhynchites rutilus septentrionalis TaxID=329112 RepID=UPI00247B1862|nr:peroxisome biogenesis factor 2-like [Toxorhynchites rutilus septentrionalis]